MLSSGTLSFVISSISSAATHEQCQKRLWATNNTEEYCTAGDRLSSRRHFDLQYGALVIVWLPVVQRTVSCCFSPIPISMPVLPAPHIHTHSHAHCWLHQPPPPPLNCQWAPNGPGHTSWGAINSSMDRNENDKAHDPKQFVKRADSVDISDTRAPNKPSFVWSSERTACPFKKKKPRHL